MRLYISYCNLLLPAPLKALFYNVLCAFILCGAILGCSELVPWKSVLNRDVNHKKQDSLVIDNDASVCDADEEQIDEEQIDEEQIDEEQIDEEQIIDEEVLVALEQKEEQFYDNSDKLNALISNLSQDQMDEHQTDGASSDTKINLPIVSGNSFVIVPKAFDTWNLSDAQCKDILKKAKIKTKKPNFNTPFVKTPMLLLSPIEGVVIKPKWLNKDLTKSVMDCRLIVALIELSREIKKSGVKEVLFYSTYRPIKTPPKKCEKGKKGKKCRKQKKAWAKAKKGKISQHRRATAIDIRFFVLNNGEIIDVLEHYERHDKKPPCTCKTTTKFGKILKDLACTLHDKKIFNVMLTPNANKAHHNHFHFDITPKAKWYIIR